MKRRQLANYFSAIIKIFFGYRVHEKDPLRIETVERAPARAIGSSSSMTIAFQAQTWLSEIRNATTGCDVVEGKTICPDKTNHPFEDVVENLTGDLLWSCNLAVSRSLFERLGGFDEDFSIAGGEDLELARRLRTSKAKIHFAPGAIVYHPVRRLSFVAMVDKVFQMHWHILYRLKFASNRSATFQEIVDLLRITAREILSPPTKRNIQGMARLAFEWAFFPAWILYLFVWECRFRKYLIRSRPEPKKTRNQQSRTDTPRSTEPPLAHTIANRRSKA